MKEQKNLIVQWDGETVGHIVPHRKGRMKFSYSPQWLEKGNRPISLSLPCSEEEFDAQRSTAFFDNLLPEEGMYSELCREARIDEADIYNFLRLFGKECAGALVIYSEESEESSQTPAYRDITNFGKASRNAARQPHCGNWGQTLHCRSAKQASHCSARGEIPCARSGIVCSNIRDSQADHGPLPGLAPQRAVLHGAGAICRTANAGCRNPANR